MKLKKKDEEDNESSNDDIKFASIHLNNIVSYQQKNINIPKK